MTVWIVIRTNGSFSGIYDDPDKAEIAAQCEADEFTEPHAVAAMEVNGRYPQAIDFDWFVPTKMIVTIEEN